MFVTPDQKRMIVYAEGNQIVYYLLSAKQATGPVILSKDYLKGLSVTDHSYCYMNFEHQVIYDLLGEGEPRVVLTESGLTGQIDKMKIAEKEGKDILLYSCLNPINEEWGYYEMNLESLHVERIESNQLYEERDYKDRLDAEKKASDKLHKEIVEKLKEDNQELTRQLIYAKERYDELSQVTKRLQEGIKEANAKKKNPWLDF